MPRASIAAPSRSGRPSSGARTSSRTRQPIAVAISPVGTLTRKIQCQLSSIRRPPIGGPSAAATPPTADQTPIAGARRWESVPIVMQRAEWEAGRERAAIERNFFQPRDYDIEPWRLRLVEGDHDLLGDGSIELLLTPGHQSVRIGDELILAIDVAHFASVLDGRRFPAFGDNHEAQSRSATRLRELRDAGFRIQPGHDPNCSHPDRFGPEPDPVTAWAAVLSWGTRWSRQGADDAERARSRQRAGDGAP